MEQRAQGILLIVLSAVAFSSAVILNWQALPH
jgi:hypothetical protein